MISGWLKRPATMLLTFFLLDAEITQESPDQLMLQGLIVFGQKIFHWSGSTRRQTNFVHPARYHRDGQRDRGAWIGMPDLLAMSQKQLHQILNRAAFQFGGLLPEGSIGPGAYKSTHRAQQSGVHPIAERQAANNLFG